VPPAREEWRTLGPLIAGMVPFSVALASSLIHPAIVAMFVLTPLFGLPWLLLGPHDRIVGRIAVVVAGFPLANCLAVGAGLSLAQSKPGFPFTMADGRTRWRARVPLPVWLVVACHWSFARSAGRVSPRKVPR
jgi:hypothetical protein